MSEIWKEKFLNCPRKTVKEIVTGKETMVNIDANTLSQFLGIKKYKFGELESEDKIGVATGLAWTEFGGEILKNRIRTYARQRKNANYWKIRRGNARVN